MKRSLATFGLWLVVVSIGTQSVRAQSFGTELHNTLMPASGGMGGVSIARPQDVVSALNANPASITQFRGTQFMFGGGWAEPTFNMTQSAPLPIDSPNPLVRPYSAKSQAPGTPLGNIGVIQELEEFGLPVTVGVGFLNTAGGFVDFRQVPESNGTNTGMAIFNAPMVIGAQLTERLSIGATTSLGIAFFDGPFVGAGGMTPDYALRGSLGANYQLTQFTTVGAYYQTSQNYRFHDAVTITPIDPTMPKVPVTVDMNLPQNIGLGLANNAMMDGNLLLAMDILYKLWNEAALYQSIYDNQWVVQLGAQLTQGKWKYRTGYVWAENPIDPSPDFNIGGVVQPGGYPSVYYTQGLLAITSQHRLSFGLGRRDVIPGVDFDLMGGGMFRDEQQLGPATRTSIESYWLGFGFTWRFNRGAITTPIQSNANVASY
ncbi:MAG: hypothetical protein WCI02_08715 [Planctomycetota bacterium]|jgi:long-chain fatty acid transport protein